MPRANRHYIPGQVWHITHMCHKKEFLLKFARDRQNWLRWLFESRKRFGLRILDYIVTSNHIHLLVVDDSGRDVIPRSLQLIAGRTGQEYNQRKGRKGAFWEDRYHATAVEVDSHLIQCLVYVDLNMVRAGVVNHPSEWSFCGYNEIQNPRQRYSIIDHEGLMELLDISNHYCPNVVWEKFCNSLNTMKFNHKMCFFDTKLRMSHTSSSSQMEVAHVSSPTGLCPTHGVSAEVRFSTVRPMLQRAIQDQKLFLLGSIPLYGLCAVNISREPSRYRSLSSVGPAQSLPYGLPWKSLPQYPRSSQRGPGLAHLCRLCPNPDWSCPASLCQRFVWGGVTSNPPL